MASEDLNALYNEARAFAEYMLLTHGEFIPFAVTMAPDGKIAQVAGDLGTEHPGSKDMVALLQASLCQSAKLGDLRAAGICMDMRIVPPGQQHKTDAMCTCLAHVSGEAFEVFVPYARNERGEFQFGQSFTIAGDEFRLAGLGTSQAPDYEGAIGDWSEGRCGQHDLKTSSGQ